MVFSHRKRAKHLPKPEDRRQSNNLIGCRVRRQLFFMVALFD
jgi:hypothetical protein